MLLMAQSVTELLDEVVTKQKHSSTRGTDSNTGISRDVTKREL
jgi:hypothetical protein